MSQDCTRPRPISERDLNPRPAAYELSQFNPSCLASVALLGRHSGKSGLIRDRNLQRILQRFSQFVMRPYSLAGSRVETAANLQQACTKLSSYGAELSIRNSADTGTRSNALPPRRLITRITAGFSFATRSAMASVALSNRVIRRASLFIMPVSLTIPN